MWTRPPSAAELRRKQANCMARRRLYSATTGCSDSLGDRSVVEELAELGSFMMMEERLELEDK